VALNFPNNPGIGSIFTDETAGFSYEWNGTVWKSFSSASSTNIKILDSISGSFNGSTTTFALTTGGVSVTPINAQQLIITLGGVTQKPGTDYTVSTTNITFTSAPEAGLSFSGISLGPATPITTIPDGTVTDGSLTVLTTLKVGTAVTVSGGIVTATGGFNLGISSAGTSITSGPVKTLNFIGTGNTFAVSGTTVDISIAGGGGGSGSFNELDATLFG